METFTYHFFHDHGLHGLYGFRQNTKPPPASPVGGGIQLLSDLTNSTHPKMRNIPPSHHGGGRGLKIIWTLHGNYGFATLRAI